MSDPYAETDVWPAPHAPAPESTESADRARVVWRDRGEIIVALTSENERLHRNALAEADAYRAMFARAESAEARERVLREGLEALASPLDDSGVTWRCSACGWVADETTIDTALWPEANRTVSMVCPECSAEGSFVDHDPLVESVSAKVHEAWMETKRSQGISSRPSEWGEEQMVPYEDLTERAKDLDRGSVTAVLDALRALLAPSAATAGVAKCRICGGVNGEHDGATHDARVADMPIHAPVSSGEAGTGEVTGWIDRMGDRWTFDADGLGHSPETAPFSRKYVEKKWGPLRPDPAFEPAPVVAPSDEGGEL